MVSLECTEPIEADIRLDRYVPPNYKQARKSKINSSVCQEIQNRGIPYEIASQAATLYERVSNGRVYRESPRLQLEFYATYHAYLQRGLVVDPNILGNKMGLKRSDTLRAFTEFANELEDVILHQPHQFLQEYVEYLPISVPLDWLPDMMERMQSITQAHEEIQDMNPCLVCKSLLYLFLQEKGVNISFVAFSEALKTTPASLQANLKRIRALL